jgi:hypothetical protein
METFIRWLSIYDPDTYETGNGVWNRASKGSASNWYDAYALALNTKDADGNYVWRDGSFTLDGNYQPIPLSQEPSAAGKTQGGGAAAPKSITTAAIKLWWGSRKPWQKWAWRLLGAGAVAGLLYVFGAFKKRPKKTRTKVKKVYVKRPSKYTR